MSQRAVSRTVAASIVWLVLCVVGCGGAATPNLSIWSDDGSAGVTRDAGVLPGDANGGTNADATTPTADATTATADASTPSADAMGCGPSTCPTGCCDKNGRCQTGDGASACGRAGQACQDCAAGGFKACDATSHACYSDMAQCGPANCKGCCLQNVCFAGTDAADCGSGGQTCQSCTATGLVCTGQQCAKPSCGPGNCTGCCIGTQCLAGTDQAACGENGGQCRDCASSGAMCMASKAGMGGTCGPGNCSPATCPGGCCDLDGVCQSGTSSTACGLRAALCQACPSGTECLAQQCRCTPTTCPTGCCNFVRGVNLTQTCEPGGLDTQCGNSGAFCQDCSQSGPYRCANQQCDFPPPPPPCLCATGCCDSLGQCQPGASNTVCGAPGETCQDCTQMPGTLCEGQECTMVTDVDEGACNEESCPSGCCDGAGVCQQGVTDLNCGGFGTNCQNCLQGNSFCSNQQCTIPDAGSVCSPANCNGCCDPLGNCLYGFDQAQCGSGGRLCVDCTLHGSQCEFGSCTTPDGSTLCSQSCPGCCDVNGNCQDGYADSQCGAYGNTCEDCTSLGPPSTCDVVVSPRTCTSQQTQCPGVYPRCPSPLQLQAPTRQKVCSTVDLKNAAGACAGGAHTMACTSFLQESTTLSAPCSLCLQSFDFDFVEQVGTRTCAASFVSATCNHNSACITDCVSESCFNCPDTPSTTQCEQQAPSGTCSTFSTADQCVTTALAAGGPAAVCNPTAYQTFGAWLQAVGATYCGM